jgi:quercetin dioxygenase-like cupin family protein
MLLLLAAWIAAATSAYAQDAVTADPKHYKVEFENDQVRVLRVRYGPGEKSVMHHHPANVAVFLTDVQAKFTLPDGKSEPASVKAGTTRTSPAETHLPESTGDQPFELILVELKGGAGQ